MDSLADGGPPEGGKQSYTTVGFSPLGVVRNGLRQAAALRGLRRNIGDTVRETLSRMRRSERSIKEACGIDLHGLKILEVGHGQLPGDIAFLSALGNECTGIDLDTTPQRLTDIAGYVSSFRKNGALRTAKTMSRALTGLNRAFIDEFCRQMNLRSWPKFSLQAMDVQAMRFGDATFDFVYSTDVFEHLSKPREAIAEIKRILKPGGGFWLRFLHYEHPNALHDVRRILKADGAPPPWAHLIPDLRGQVQQGAFVNDLGIGQWMALFNELCPGNIAELEPLHDSAMAGRLKKMRAAHPELNAFADEHLLTEHLVVGWRKP